MATAPDLQEPQIAAARAQAWHHTGDALLTLEAARIWLNNYGLVFFAPQPAIAAPAPSLVEATLGTAKASVVLADTAIARTLTARLVGEGSALPLNLLGGPGDLPDFIVSASAFPFIFTLRGDKGWKRPPETSGAVKVTPLGLRVYELLTEKGAMTIANIVPEIGREVTDSAIARALSELWQLLRVIPVLQQGEGETLWELTTTRFLKAVKAGANAGQPTALSALASLYLTQAYVATEEEIAGYLSPLTARSRVRDVLHGLTAGRQLAEGVINGKTVLYMPDALPDFALFAEPEPESETELETAEEGSSDAVPSEEGEAGTDGEAPRERIRTFDQASARPQDRNLRGKPVRREGARDSSRPASDRPAREGFAKGPRADRGPAKGGAPRSFGPRTDRPARRDGAAGGFDRPRPASDRPTFNRPWDEERGSRPPRSRDAGAGADRPGRPPRRSPAGEGEGRPSRPFNGRTEGRPPRRDGERPFRPRESSPGGSAGDRPQRTFRPRTEGGDRPFRPRPEGGDRPFRPRPEGGGEGSSRPFRPRTEGGDRPFRPRTEGGDRPFRPRTEGGDRPFRPRTEGGDRPFRARPASGARPFRPREGGPREGGFRERSGPGARPSSGFGGGRPKRPFTPGGAAGRGRPPFGRSAEGGPPRGDRPQGRSGDRPSFRPGGGAGGGGGFRPPAKRAGFKPANRPDRPARPSGPARPEDEA